MRKALIFLSSFIVSTIVIYSIWYYSQIGKYQRGIVASAGELPHTVIGSSTANDSAVKNFIFSTGLIQAAGIDPKVLRFPDTNRLFVNAPYSNILLQNVNLEISRKFPSHPPISFPGAKEGGKVLFSYFFRNVQLPEGFHYGMKTIEGHEYKTLRFSQSVAKASGSNVRLLASSNNGFLLIVPLYGGTEEAVFASLGEGPVKGLLSFPDSLMKELTERNLRQGISVETPFLDFSISKLYPNDSALRLSGYAYKEERLKVKTSPPLAGTEINKRPMHPKDYSFSFPAVFYLKRKADGRPYFAVIVRNPELLIRLHQ